ncbi:GspE/PulE family protein [Chitiniphilus purpureus]|uniref:GspE/PulE family protein n=1 Tax=Chitiniphilus purpureus TaxID=2981137 RepID=A0ABY6DLG9_9NEIS|nr:GspE/PulE family protein [Chitiniphilus sp. CD1]UXY15219.1 GspE/PulE family protein [Chitiniphilus sp. CD1]
MSGSTVLQPAAIAEARAAALAQARPLLTVLEEASGLPPEGFVAALGELFRYPVRPMSALLGLTPRFELLSYAECAQRGLICAADDEHRLWLIVADPFDAELEAWIAARVLQPFGCALAHRDDITAFLARQEEQLRAMHGLTDGQAGAGGGGEHVEDITLARINDDDSPVVRLVNSTLYDALKLQASDIHLECDAGCLYIKYRIDGVIVEIGQVNGQEMAEQVVSRVKVMADLDIAERRIPQDGRFKVRVKGREVDFRVSVMPNIFGEDAVLRLLDRQSLTEAAQALRLDSLGLDEASIAQMRRLAGKPNGMLLVTGPTGSGKTTTLYATLTEVHTGQDKIITIEDPVEYRLPRVLQIPVNEKKGLTFAKGLRSILRHDPDKIMVGEIRDEETAQIAVQAALTGHLVFTSVHANNVFDVLGRFMHMGVDPYSFAAALNGIVAQRLLRTNCPHCAADIPPDAEQAHLLGLSGLDLRGWRLRAGQGCGQCRGTGYKGRRAVVEVMVMNDVLRELIASKAPVARLKEEAQQAGMRPLRLQALEWVARGETTLQEVMRVVG